jgi:hypothetical protein
MDKLTLDTNALRDWAWANGLTAEKRHQRSADRDFYLCAYSDLTRLRDAGICELAVPPQFSADFWRTDGVPPEDLARLIGPTIALVTPGLSTYPIHYAAEYFDEKTSEDLFRAIYPQTLPCHKKYRSNQRDAILIYAHFVAQRDYFITSDGAIIDAAVQLKRRWSLNVVRIGDYVRDAGSSSGLFP